MDALDADRLGLPWCARCEVTEGAFVIVASADPKILCASCAAGQPAVPFAMVPRAPDPAS